MNWNTAWTIVCLVAIVWGTNLAAYRWGRKDGETAEKEKSAEHRRGIRGFDRPAPRTAATEARVHVADWRPKQEGFDK